MTDLRETIARAILDDLPNRNVAYVEALDCVTIDGHCDLLSAASAVLSAIKAAGYVVVPRQPTEAMLGAGAHQWTGTVGRNCCYRTGGRIPPTGDCECREGTVDSWEAMIAAAPPLTPEAWKE